MKNITNNGSVMENANLELLIADQLLEVLEGLLTPAGGI